MQRFARVLRYREKALNAAALMAALATSRIDNSSRLRDLSTRQDDLLADLVHDFAFSARKMIELAERAGLPVRETANQESVVGQGLRSDSDDDDLVSLYSLWFVLGRIVHSDHFVVERGQVPLDFGDLVVHHEAPWGFSVQSDYDREDRKHFILIEFLLERFLVLDEQLQRLLRFNESIDRAAPSN